jgi:hypothetical protein
MYRAEIVLFHTVVLQINGLGHQMNIFLRPLILNHYFLYMRKWFINFLSALLKRHINIKFLASFNTLTNSKKYFKKYSSRDTIPCVFKDSVPKLLEDRNAIDNSGHTNLLRRWI